MTRPPLTITVHTEPRHVTLRLVGELDYETTHQLVRAVRRELEGKPARLRIDCGGLVFCDTTGLSGLLDVRRRAAAAGCELYLDERPARLQRLLEITGTLAHLTGTLDADEWQSAQDSDQARSDA